MNIGVKQRDATDCGPACLASVARYYKLNLPIARIRQSAGTDKKGTNVLGMVRAAENFDFDARFSVVSATVYFSGSNFPSVQTASLSGGNLGALSAQLAKCVPGTAVIFDNVKVQGPDGVVRTIQNAPGFSLY